MKHWLLYSTALSLVVWSSFSSATEGLVCQEEVNPESYQNCLANHHHTLSQQLSESKVRQKLKPVHFKVIFPVTGTLQEVLHTTADKIYYTAQQVSNRHYQVTFDLNPFCQSNPDCMIGALYAAELEGKLPENEYLAYEEPSKKTHIKIPLAKKVKGYLEKPLNNGDTNSGFRTFIWNYHGVQYQLTLKGYQQKQFVELANHLIEVGY